MPDNKTIYDENWASWTDMKRHGPATRRLRCLLSLQLGKIRCLSTTRRWGDRFCGLFARQ